MLSVDTAIHQGDAIEIMRDLPSGSVDLVFADPPFNIGYEYDNYDDEKSDEAYLEWSRHWMEEVHRLLTPTGTFWLAIGDEYAADLKVMAERQIGFSSRSWVVWYYTFGVNCVRKFSRSHAHLFHFVKDPDAFTFNSDDPQVRVPSARALVYGDKRANPKGRLPDDTWILRPQDFQSDCYGFDPLDDTWYFSRVAGTFKERQGFHGCQMPEQLLGRIIRVSSNPGEMVFDPFAGSGTTLAVAKKLGRRFMGCELSEQYVLRASERLDQVREGDPLDGPADPIASAPTTAAGRRLRGQPLLPLFKEEDFSGEPTTESETNGEALSHARPNHTPAPAVASPPVASGSVRELQDRVLIDSLAAVSQGHSIERFLADPELQHQFHARCEAEGLLGSPAIWNRRLLDLRREGKLPKSKGKATKITASELDPYQFAAEIAWRLSLEKFGDLTLSDLFSCPDKSRFFDRNASRYAPGHPAAHYRRGALLLRKTAAALAAEAKEYHYVLATRDFGSLQRLSSKGARGWGGKRGVYLLAGAKKTPLFVGEALDLGSRLEVHRQAPATRSVATHFAVIAEEDLPSGKYRPLLKVDLAGRYQTAWNVVSH